jgi:hypothetical protein
MTSIVKKSTLSESEEVIKVFVRVRPSLAREDDGEHAVSFVTRDELRVKSRTGDSTCKFDRVFPPQTTQEDVYNAVRDCAQNCIEGFNSTCFAYGQTGSGKTFTMFGDDRNGNDIYSTGSLSRGAGLIPRVVRDIFDHVKKNRKTCTAVVSFLQIYNERIYDLLRDPGRGTSLSIKEDNRVGLYVDGLSEFVVNNESECLRLLRAGDESRAVRHTEMNDYSSRSHTIFQIILESRTSDNPDNVIRSKLNLVDLAGSEKWNVHSYIGNAHAAELSNINLSLTVLRRCMEALSKGPSGNVHVPYRDSKLTRLLQDSIGGTAKTRLLCMMSPVASNAEESLATLRFADCAKNVLQHTRITAVRVIDEDMVERMERELAQLRAKVIHYESGGQTPSCAFSSERKGEAACKLPLINDQAPPSATDTSAAPRREASEAVASGGSTQELQDLKQNYGMLVGVVEAIDRVCSKFFRFEVEEEELQVEMRDHLAKSRAIIRSGKSKAKALPFIQPSNTGSESPLGMTPLRGRENKAPSVRRTNQTKSGGLADLKRMKFRVRQKGNAENGQSTVFDPFANEEAEAAKLRQRLEAAQKKVEKQRKIQEYLKKKAEKEDAQYQEEIDMIESQRKLAIEKENKRKQRAKEQKEKLTKWKQDQLAELDSLLMAE